MMTMMMMMMTIMMMASMVITSWIYPPVTHWAWSGEGWLSFAGNHHPHRRVVIIIIAIIIIIIIIAIVVDFTFIITLINVQAALRPR